MSKPEKSTPGCWIEPPVPSTRLLENLGSGAWCVDGEPPDVNETLARLRREDVETLTVFVGAGTCGLGAGAGKTLEAARAFVQEKGIAAEIIEVGCIGLCSEEPIMDVQLPGKPRISFCKVGPGDVSEILTGVMKGEIPHERVLGQFRNATHRAWDGIPQLDEHPFLKPQTRVVLANSGIIDPTSIDEYIAWGGYTAFTETLLQRTPDEVCGEVLDSGLRGRGGGGFPTGRKWQFARAERSSQKYLICNADEGDPGAFMDRAVCESDPHRLIEGMAIAAYAIGASKAYIYIRAEYPLGIKRLKQAIAQANRYGFLGKNILDSGFDLEIKIKMGAGAFVCGEETALMHSIEGKRGMPRPRPPFPAKEGLFGKPTIINNVETLSNVPSVLSMGGDTFASYGTPGSKGTKVFALSGMVNRTGLVEIAMGTSLRDIVFQIGGGIPGGKKCKAVQIGGPSGGCIPEAHLDILADYEVLKEFGAIIGSGGLVVLDESTCMVDLAKYFMEFIQSESCGKCIPCREGTRRMLEILNALTRNRKGEKDLEALLRFQGIMELERLAKVIQETSLCGLGQTAPNPVLSTLKWFRSEYEAHLYERACPAGACKELVGAPCETACPVGTEVWRYVAHIARGEMTQAYRAIREANPLPSTCARVCNHPCETACRCGVTGAEPIAVRTLKRHVVDNVDPSAFRVEMRAATDSSKRVAIIGGGPSGLTAAHCLAAKGHRVSLFERENQLGGMLVCAIPEYRLPRDVLHKEIEALLQKNVTVELGKELSRDFTVDELLEQGFDAVFLAVGAHQSKKLGLDGEDVKGVLPGVAFLKAHNLHGEELARGRVGVIGGGNSAIDAARVALRQKDVTEVTVFYRRGEHEMPAYREEIEAAREEGIEIRELLAPVAVLSSNGALSGMRFVRNELGAPDDSGRRRPVPVAGSEFEVELDTLVVAISEQPEQNPISGVNAEPWGGLKVNPESLITSRPRVFAGGDGVRGPSTVIEAVADGKNAAEMIDRYLSGKALRRIKHVKLPTVYVAPAPQDNNDTDGEATRVLTPTLPVERRHKCFAEVDLAVSESAAIREARRCLRCDLDFTQPE